MSEKSIVSCSICKKIYRISKNAPKEFYKCKICGYPIENPFFKENSVSSLYRIVNLEQGTSEWKQWRLGGFGASDIPVLMGENPWRSIKTLLKEKSGQGRDFQNEAMRRGQRLEPEARQAYCNEVGYTVHPLCLQHTKYSWARASLDGISENRKNVVEIKCGKSAYQKALDGEIPKYYYGQLQHILFLTGLNMIDYWCYLPEEVGIMIQVERNDLYIEDIIQKGEEYKNILQIQF